MKKVLLLLSMGIVILSGCTNTPKMKIVKATSDMVSIRDGKNFYENAWTIVPSEKPDVYTSSNAHKKITFYTDIDSITFDVEPNQTYDFIILLNEKDSAWTQIQMAPTRLDMLKAGAEYNPEDDRFVPEWSYLPANDPNLVKLKKEFDLESIAGKGDEVSRILNLLYWAHDVVRHDGNSDNPNKKNASDLIRICKQEDRGVNCRMMATILNECYLAMGFKSRAVTCMPRETDFDDCHVINMVFSHDLNKWIWVDPTFAAYVKDENEVLLGIDEVRERLVNDQPLFLNEDANWNHEAIQKKEYYLDLYMAKNLYRIECPVVSGYDVETAADGKTIEYIQLLPLDGIQQSPQKEEKIGQIITYINYKTNNPKTFWAAPEF